MPVVEYCSTQMRGNSNSISAINITGTIRRGVVPLS
jgi:hypothetical protein